MRNTDRAAGERLNVVVVEDNPGDVRLIREGFDQRGIDRSLTVVTDGEEALDYLYRRNGYESATEPDLLLLDLNLPKKSGDVILETIGDDRDLRSIPVVVLSSSRVDSYVRNAVERGADGYFTKPVDPNEFISLVGAIGESISTDGTLPRGEHSATDRAR